MTVKRPLSNSLASFIENKSSRPRMIYQADLNRDLLRATTEDKLEEVKKLLNEGADVNATDGAKVTPLMIAVSKLNSQMVTLLLKQGADANHRCGLGYSPLLNAIAAYECPTSFAITSRLLDAGAYINVEGYKHSPLMYAVSKQHVSLVRLFIERGADLNIQDKNLKFSLLDFAIIVGNSELVKLLLDSGAPFNSKKAMFLTIDNNYNPTLGILEMFAIHPKTSQEEIKQALRKSILENKNLCIEALARTGQIRSKNMDAFLRGMQEISNIRSLKSSLKLIR